MKICRFSLLAYFFLMN